VSIDADTRMLRGLNGLRCNKDKMNKNKMRVCVAVESNVYGWGRCNTEEEDKNKIRV